MYGRPWYRAGFTIFNLSVFQNKKVLEKPKKKMETSHFFSVSPLTCRVWPSVVTTWQAQVLWNEQKQPYPNEWNPPAVIRVETQYLFLFYKLKPYFLGLPCAGRPSVDPQVIWYWARKLALKMVVMGGRSYADILGFCMIYERFSLQNALFLCLFESCKTPAKAQPSLPSRGGPHGGLSPAHLLSRSVV